jgi:hypothetical protein
VDGWTASNFKGQQMQTVDQQTASIKANMPETYKSIQAKAAEIGKPAFALVRRGLRGEANCFYAFERGHVVGTPFALADVTREVAYHMVAFGTSSVCIWADTQITTSTSTA